MISNTSDEKLEKLLREEVEGLKILLETGSSIPQERAELFRLLILKGKLILNQSNIIF